MTIDFDAYLKDIDPDNVCGEYLRYDAKFLELEETINGKSEQQRLLKDGEKDSSIDAKPTNWRDIKKQSEALLSLTIDLQVLIYYLRALTELEGFSGLQDGLTLIRTLVENRWATLHPQLNPEYDNDPTKRINILKYLCNLEDKSSGENILPSLQKIPLLESKKVGRFSFRDIGIAAGKLTATSNEKEVNQAIIDAAIQDSELDYLQQTCHAITASLDNLEQLESSLTKQTTINNTLNFADLSKFLKECKAFLLASIEKKTGGADTDQALVTEGDTFDSEVITANPRTSKSALGVINNNQDVIKTLNQVCDYYRKNEPSSPVPLFVERAIKMVGKNFIDALKDIAPSGVDEAKTILGKQHDEDENN